ncbi:MAG TPA: enolase C-terminal domain-like protein [Verrucomicrobiae bacterium]|jgi:L-Ala-D/L-Glu epimerase|nr:enolase C-terminal domain-like protein [Verrucomicrobiae bacterium]
MKIAQIETQALEMPYTKPLVTATNNFTVARGLLVKVITDRGIEGYGYSDLFPRTGETPQTAQHVIESVLKAKLLGKELEDLVRLRADIDRTLTGNPRAKAALETAMHDALARSYHIPLFLMLGGRYRSEIKVIKMVSVGDPDAMAEEAKQLVGAGLSLKLKVGGKIEKDMPRVAAVRKAVGEEVFIKVDANESYDAKTAIRLAKGLADYGVEVFEQPVPRDQLDALWEVKKHAPIKIEADQSARSFADVQMMIKNRMVDSVNTGIPKVGSIGEVRRIAELCEANGIRCALSNTAGSMVGDAAAVHLAASTPGIAPLCELGEFEVITGDPFFGLSVEKGTITVPEGEGLGVSLRGF